MRISDWSSDVCSSDLTVLLSGTATSQQLQNIGAAIHPAHIPHGSPEQAALRDFLLGQGDQSKASLARRASIWLVLDLYRNGIEPGDINGLRQALSTRALPNGQPYQPPGKTVDRSDEHTSELQSLMRHSTHAIS